MNEDVSTEAGFVGNGYYVFVLLEDCPNYPMMSGPFSSDLMEKFVIARAGLSKVIWIQVVDGKDEAKKVAEKYKNRKVKEIN